MKTRISVENGKVVVRTDENVVVFSYSQATRLKSKPYTASLVGEEILHTENAVVIRAAYRRAGDMLGMSVASYIKQIKGAAKRAYIDPVDSLIKRFCLVRRPTFKGFEWKINPYKVDMVNKNADVIQQYIDDGNGHLAAYGMIVGNAKEAKATLGKKLWKRLRNTSKSRNDLICSKIIHNLIYGDNNLLFIHKAKGMVKYYSSIPTTLLNKLEIHDMEFGCGVSNSHNIDDLITKIAKYIGGPMYKVHSTDIKTNLDLINDTAGMREGFNPKWSIRRMIREHTAGIRDQMTKDYTKDLYDSVKYFTSSYKYKGCTAELITSSFDLATHGKEQHHCVGMFCSEATNGRIVVYKITDKSGVISTLGIFNPNGYAIKRPTQHYVAWNQQVTDKDTLLLAGQIESEVHKIMSDHPKIISISIKPCKMPAIMGEVARVADDIPF